MSSSHDRDSHQQRLPHTTATLAAVAAAPSSGQHPIPAAHPHYPSGSANHPRLAAVAPAAAAAAAAGAAGGKGDPSSDFQTTTLTRRRPPPAAAGLLMKPVGGVAAGAAASSSSSANADHVSEMDLATYHGHQQHQLHRASLHASSGDDSGMASSSAASSSTHLVGILPPRHHELRRPDSVITTSSIVSSDAGSQMGDADCPPSVYTISGLYSSGQQQQQQQQQQLQEHKVRGSSIDRRRPEVVASDSKPHQIHPVEKQQEQQQRPPLQEQQQQQQQQQHLNATNAISKAPTPSGHRRQASHPGNLDGTIGALLRKAPAATAATCTPCAVAAAVAPPVRGMTRELLQHGGGGEHGHRRSNSYGHHRALTATCSLGSSGVTTTATTAAAAAAAANTAPLSSVFHPGASASAGLCHQRRTGSSVLETLQTLACSAGAGVGEHCRCGARLLTREETIAHFLEQLKKEQQEKCEKQELHEMQDELEDLRDCGIGGFRPKLLQGLANIKVFVLLLSILVTLQQALSSGYLNSVITTIEKRYEIPSSITGIVASMYEIGNMGSVIFVSYLGSKRHIPTWIGMGALVMGIGSITFSLPHFLSGPYMAGHSASPNASTNNMCRAPSSSYSSAAAVAAASHHLRGGTHPLAVGGAAGKDGGGGVVVAAAAPDDIAAVEGLLETLPGLDKIKSLTEGLSSSPQLGPHNNNYNREDNCIEEANESSAMPIFIFMVAQLLLGCGGSPLFTLGTTYVDNHVKRDDSSMYIGIMYSMCAFGPVCGFLLGAYLLSHHVDSVTGGGGGGAGDPDGLHPAGGYDGGGGAADGLLGPDGHSHTADRHWVGMWWGGFLICGASLISIALPFFFFPKELKKEKVKVYIDEKYHHATDPSIRPKPKEDKAAQQQQQQQQQQLTDVNAIQPASNDDATAIVVSSSAPASRSATLKSTSASQAGGAGGNGDNYGKDIKDIPRSTWKLLTNKIYMVTCLGACMELIIVSGFIVFLPKYLETQFALSKSMASMFTGGIAIPGACIGIFLGGWLLKRLQLRPRGAVQFVLLCNLACLACYCALFFFGCDNVKMAGTTMPYFYSNQSEPFKINLTASCNFGCECDVNDVQPVCGANGLTYFSPCHAGCTGVGAAKDNFTDCACVVNSFPRPPAEASALHGGSDGAAGVGGDFSTSSEFAEVTMVPVATAGPCYSTCQMILPFMVLLFFMTLVVAVTQMPVLMVVLRSVEEEEKAFALGIQFVIFRIFGYIPSPILFGNVIDSTCLLWKSTCEGEAGGRCLMYDIELFRYKYVGVCCFIKLLSLMIFLVDWWLIRNRQNAEKKNAALTVGEVVNSIISLDKLFEPDGPLWLKMTDPEGGGGRDGDVGGSDDDDDNEVDADVDVGRHRVAVEEEGREEEQEEEEEHART